MMTTNQQQPASTRKSVTGFVTKLVGDGATYGFINDEIFFQQANVTGGGPAAVNDRVFAECEYSAHLPIKWNATSVKIISKAAGQQQSQASNILESDPRKQPRPNLLNQQQPPPPPPQQQQQPQQPFNQSPNPSVAVTYQQHRQQRQLHRQTIDTTQQQDNSIAHQPPPDQSARILDQGNSSGETFYGLSNPPAFPPQQQPDIQPFQDTPMGPPKLTYTSQLGSAFVQNPIMSAPFLHQQPPPLLPQQQLPPQPQQHLPPMSQMGSQNNQRQHNHHNKGGRFNNQVDKNDRQNNRRIRNDGKFDQNRPNDRDGPHNNRSSRPTDPRDRSANRGTVKRDDVVIRPSPPSHSSARSTTSVSSDRGIKGRRHYDAQNIPKSRIMTNLNGWNMRQRCSSSIHVPSDLKNVVVNQYFRLDIKNTPKPLNFRIEQVKSEATNEVADGKSSEDQVAEVDGSQQVEKVMDDQDAQDEQREPDVEESQKVAASKKEEKNELLTPPSSKSDIKLNHKYGVKVILISLPELETIYKKVFGPELDSFTNDSRTYPRLDETISLLCNKGSTGGHSLIGGKFDPVLDGFIEGETNEFERHGRQPDLIATCRRVVLEQTGLDLGPCKSWTLISTFMYNNKSDYFSPKASIEYSFIYMPQIWTMMSGIFDESITEKESLKVDASDLAQGVESECPKMDVHDSTKDQDPDSSVTQEQDSHDEQAANEINTGQSPLTLENLADLKVIDLKFELDKRGIKYKPNAKKAELVSLLQESLTAVQDQSTAMEAEQSVQAEKNVDSQIEEEEVAVVDTSEPEKDIAEDKTEDKVEDKAEDVAEDTAQDAIGITDDQESTGKRKASDDETDEQESKRVCTGESKKEEKVELIKEPFVVKAREGQQQLSLVSLYDAIQVSRYDQFELSVASSILKEALIQHLSEYIFTALVEDNRQKMVSQGGEQSGNSSCINSQETNSDTNNNNTKQTFKNPATNSSSDKIDKEFPVDRYANLAFTYFDSSHTGYLQAEDLNKLFNNTGLTISKRALISLIGDGEKFNYKTLPDLPPTLSSFIYKFPEQFNRLPSSSSSKSNTISGRMIEYQGVSYDVEKLFQQVRDAEALRVSLVDRFNYAIENYDKQAEEIHVLEVSQKSLSKAIKSQNDEICELKRERDSIKKKFDSLKKGIKATISSLGDLVKEEK